MRTWPSPRRSSSRDSNNPNQFSILGEAGVVQLAADNSLKRSAVRVRIPPPAPDPEPSIDTRSQAALGVRMGSSSEKKSAGWSKGLTAATDARVRRMALARLGQTNWAKGLTAATDLRVARQAATRRGKRRGRYRLVHRSTACGALPVTTERERAYAYVLGMYLGDGHIA